MLSELEAGLGYTFRDKSILENALTHSSYANENRERGLRDNERLEFLGDSILGFVVADYLYRSFPDRPEGELTRIRADLVCEKNLARAAGTISLGSFLLLGHGEEHGGKQDTPFLTALCARQDAFVVDLDDPAPALGCVVMASGLGRRFGGNKLMADFCGAPLIANALALAALPLLACRIVVTRSEEVEALCNAQGVPVLRHAQPYRSDTVRLGLAALLGKEPALRGCLFLPGDQPLLTQQSVEALALAAAPDAIVRLCAADGTPGSPVLFGADYFEELRSLPEGKGGGVVVKYNANQRYTTDAVSSAIFRSVCRDAGVPVQVYANRSDLPGGSTLGSIANSQVSLNTVDIGLAQLAMHSAYETAATADLGYLVDAMTEFYGRSLTAEPGAAYSL